MNEIFKQLYHKTTGKDWAYDFDPEIAEKFAKMIVQECVHQLQARKYDDPDNSAEHYVNQGLTIGIELIKEHFGV